MICNCVFLSFTRAQSASSKYELVFKFIDKDKSFTPPTLPLQHSFTDQVACSNYITRLPTLLGSMGYPTASVDSFTLKNNSAEVQLFLGRQYRWIMLEPGHIEKEALSMAGYLEKNFSGKLLNIPQLQNLEQGVLNYYERNGYPFAEIFLDSVRLEGDRMNAFLNTRKGPLYHIDSMRIFGKGKVSKEFLRQYLGIPDGSIYNKDKLELVNKRILELPYVQQIRQSDITMLGTGAVLNLYLDPRKSSQANFLLGLLPSSSQTGKLQLTADVNLDLKNALNSGETILLNWQQLQVKSPRLNLGYQQPYIFHSSFGADLSFNLFKKDSTYLQLNGQAGLQYILSASKSGKVFVQWQKSYLLGNAVDTNLVIATKRLPPDIDVNSVNVGIDYQLNRTDYRFNPRSGNEFKISLSAGIKTVGRNNEIISIKDPNFNYASLYDSLKEKSYQLRIIVMASHYFPIGKQATVKTALNLGLFSSPGTFRNELFQIGGYRLLRGFDEESIYASQYGVFTAEYRYRLALNSFLFGFTDAGWIRNKYQLVDLTNTFIGAGGGLAFETKFGLLNISYAVGKRGDVKFNFREAQKIHFGYVNYF